MFSPNLEQLLQTYIPMRSSDADCASWHRMSHQTGCADEHGQCGHAMNCPMFRRWVRESDPL
jgi:hypothetical protein